MTTPTTIAQVRDELATILSTIQGLTGFAYLSDVLNDLPAAHVAMPAYDPRLVLGGSKQQYQFRIDIYAHRALELDAQKKLDALREPSGATSIVEAVQDSDNWSVDIDYAQVTSVGEIGSINVAGVDYMGFTVDVEACW